MKLERIEDGVTIERAQLPSDDPLTLQILGGQRAKVCDVYVGCPEWGASGYRGVLFPESAERKNYRRLYAQQFNSVELNATGYRIPTTETIESWVSGIPTDFVFCPKLPQPIAQVRPIGKDATALHQFDTALDAFGGHLGAVLLSLHPNFGVSRVGELSSFLQNWSMERRVHLELRDAGWFENQEIRSNLFNLIAGKGVGTVITDIPARQSAIHMTLTTKSAYVRFSDSSQIPTQTDFDRLKMWSERCSEWIELGLERLFFFCHGVNPANAPILCDYFIAEMNRIGKVSLKRPQLIASVAS